MSSLWPYPGLEDRVFLDYPLDILLNRECSLKSHEGGLVPILKAYEAAVGALKKRAMREGQAQLLERIGNLICEQVGKKQVRSEQLEEDLSLEVKDWQAAAKGQWQKVFDDPRSGARSAVGANTRDKFEKAAQAQLKRAGGCPVKCERLALEVLKFHSLLCHRTIGSLLLPDKRGAASGERRLASGNIVIEGTTGTGKSTLALQFALAMTHWPNQYNAVYVSLEESVANLRAKARSLSQDWCERLQPVAYLDDIEEGSPPGSIGERLKELLWQPGNCPMRAGNPPGGKCPAHVQPPLPMVLLPGLSPRNIVGQRAEGHGLFWERLQQVERLLVGAEWLRDHKEYTELPPIRLVCIDSLNTFGDQLLSRKELCRLFDLFRQYGVIGLCTVEAGPETEQMASSDLVDILIRLDAEKDAGYFTRYFEIVKSRYQHQIYGRHPYKIRSEENLQRERPTGVKLDRTTLFQALRVYPSIHTVVAATELDSADRGGEPAEGELGTPPPSLKPPPSGSTGQGARDSEDRFDFGIEALRQVLSRTLKPRSVLAVVGEHNTFKTPLAQHFLLYGLSDRKLTSPSKKKSEKKAQESALLVRLHEQVSFDPGRMSSGPSRKWMLGDDLFSGDECLIHLEKENWIEKLDYRLDSGKLVQRCYRYQSQQVGTHGPLLFELALKGGLILPEEFLQFVRNILRSQSAKHSIRRVVLDNVALIGASYPFLRHSQNAGDLFLSAFVHVMRNYCVDLLLLGTRTGLAAADEMVNLACTLADEVLTCEYCDVFGDRYVTVRGGGVASGEDQRVGGESPGRQIVPAVITRRKGDRFSVDLGKLKGLVGFGTNRIHRPGLAFHTFQENDSTHRDYNREVEESIGAALGVSRQRPVQKDAADGRERAGVEVVAFGPERNQSFHDGLGLMAGKPIDKTIVATVDEFFVRDLQKAKEGTRIFADPPRSLDGKPPSHLRNIEKRMKAPDIGVVPYYANSLVVACRSDIRVDPVADG